MHRTKREFVNEVLIRKRPFPKLPALVSPPGGYAGITWTQPHANKAVEAGVHTSFVHSSIISATTPPPLIENTDNFCYYPPPTEYGRHLDITENLQGGPPKQKSWLRRCLKTNPTHDSPVNFHGLFSVHRFPVPFTRGRATSTQ